MYYEVLAGIAFGLSMFGAGFCCGTIRVLLVAPTVGEFAAVLMELPLMLYICWRLGSMFVEKFNGSKIQSISGWSIMGLIAFATLLFLDIGLSLLAFDKTLQETIQDLTSPKGTVGTICQLISSFLPLLQVKSKEKKRIE